MSSRQSALLTQSSSETRCSLPRRLPELRYPGRGADPTTAPPEAAQRREAAQPEDAVAGV